MQAVPVWRTLTHHFPCAADNTHVFRDIKRVSSRKVLELDPSGRKVIEVRCAAPACWRAERLGSRECGGCGAPASQSSAAGADGAGGGEPDPVAPPGVCHAAERG